MNTAQEPSYYWLTILNGQQVKVEYSIDQHRPPDSIDAPGCILAACYVGFSLVNFPNQNDVVDLDEMNRKCEDFVCNNQLMLVQYAVKKGKPHEQIQQ